VPFGKCEDRLYELLDYARAIADAPVNGMPGWKTRLFLITYPAGAEGSSHSHPLPGVGYVLEGTVVSAFDDDADGVILAGQGFQDKASFHRVSREAARLSRCGL
jgi:hypothetical protein